MTIDLKTIKHISKLSRISVEDSKAKKLEVKSENIREQILKNSPDENEDFFVVPRVVE
jgi:aspartyl-tRNA(Asn)/glutamyl-tRNA(Gln) amidotransferase subunit C